MSWQPLCTIRVPVDIGRTTQNRTNAARLKDRLSAKRAARLAGYRAWQDAGSPRLRCQVRVSMTAYRARALDALNLWGAVKPICDGLFVGNEQWEGRKLLRRDPALLPDDSEKWVVMGEARQEIDARHRGRECVEFLIETQAPVNVERPAGVFGSEDEGMRYAEAEALVRGHDLRQPWKQSGWWATCCERCSANAYVREAGRAWEARGLALVRVCVEVSGE